VRNLAKINILFMTSAMLSFLCATMYEASFQEEGEVVERFYEGGKVVPGNCGMP
jgi:hypothetical protein